ncbi:MAG: ribose-phosphate pyrophosphokinase [Proteobacteria bacterium]|nr:ribose-phosphate pyrophosphokinase [Pseudomonadota bacterium]NBP12828.1 ribose-phosphate pyrophosphokinase [bacterium]
MKQAYKTWKYSGGEVGVRVENSEAFDTVFRIQNSDDLIAMFMAIDAYEYDTGKDIRAITIPYLPYARQDRVATKGDPFAIGVLASLIASAGITHVKTIDLHSEKSIKTFAQEGIFLESVSPVKYIEKYLENIGVSTDKVVFVAPDKGSHEKTERYCKALDVDKAIQCGKTRSPIDGSLMGFFVDSDFSVSQERIINESVTDLVIVDDICDGGGTFLGVADAIRKAYPLQYNIHLWTTHGIYSKGVNILLEKFDTLGCTNSFTNNQENIKLNTIQI